MLLLADKTTTAAATAATAIGMPKWKKGEREATVAVTVAGCNNTAAATTTTATAAAATAAATVSVVAKTGFVRPSLARERAQYQGPAFNRWTKCGVLLEFWILIYSAV